MQRCETAAHLNRWTVLAVLESRAGTMTILRRLATPIFAVSLAMCSSGLYAQYGQGPPPPPGAYGQGGGWDAPPQEYNDYRRRGFQDGIEGARKDVENHRRPTPNNRDEFRHPNVPGQFRHDYRDGFRRGYDVGMRHMMNGGPRY